MNVDWARMAEPQHDGYDSAIALRLVNVSPLNAGPGVWFDVHPVYRDEPGFVGDFSGFRDAPPDHPNLALGAVLVDAWPEGATLARRMIRIVHAAYEDGVTEDLGWSSLVSSSHSYEHRFGTCFLTVHSPIGVAEALIHEAAHHKLRALGVRFESADAIVAPESVAQRHPSPLLGGRMRPMPAVIHAHYVLVHLIAFENAMLRAKLANGRALVRRLLARNIELLARSSATLRRALVVDSAGAVFMETLWRWQERALAEAEIYR
jgi:HEXXH motif-containing protein